MLGSAETRAPIVSGVTEAVTPSTSSSSYEERKLSGRCTYKGCPADACEDNQLCEKHRIAERLRVASAMARMRKRRRAAGCCTWCGTRIRATDLPPTKAKTASCKACREERNRAANGVTDGVTTRSSATRAARIAERTVIDADNRVRYRGQSRRGRMSVADENRMDFDAMERDLVRARDNDEHAESPEVKQMPRIQRAEKKRSAMDWVVLVVRTGLQVIKRNDPELARALGDQISDFSEDDDT